MMAELVIHNDLQHTVDVLARALHDDPLGRYFQLDTYGLPNSTTIDLEQSRRWFTDLVSRDQSEGAVLIRLEDGGAVSVWIPPSITSCIDPQNGHNEKEQPVSFDSIVELETLSQKARGRYLRGKACWSLELIARDQAYRGPPVTGRTVGPFVERARKEGCAVCLDASNRHARDVYLSLGFRVAEELKVGEGRCDESGNLIEGGKGITVWSMVID